MSQILHTFMHSNRRLHVCKSKFHGKFFPPWLHNKDSTRTAITEAEGGKAVPSFKWITKGVLHIRPPQDLGLKELNTELIWCLTGI